MIKYFPIIASAILLINPNLAQASTFSSMEPYAETTKGKTSVCGVNFYGVISDDINSTSTAISGSLFIMPSKNSVSTAIRVNEVILKEKKYIPLEWAKLSINLPDGHQANTENFIHVNNPDALESYSAISQNEESSKLLALISLGGEVLVKETNSPTDIKYILEPAKNMKAHKEKIDKCLTELMSTVAGK